MPDWSFADYSRQSIMGTGAFSRGGTISAHTVANTKGCFIGFPKVVTFDSDWISIGVGGRIQSTGRSLIDFAGGTQGGNRSVFFENLPLPGDTETFIHYTLPYKIPSQTPLSASLQSNVAGVSASISVSLHGAGFAHLEGYSRAKVYGANIATSNLTQVTPGATNVKGSWVEICSSLDFNSQCMTIIVVPFTTMTNCDMMLDIGIGDSGSERVLIGDLILGGEASNNVITPNSIGPLPTGLPMNTRITARVQSSGASSISVGIIALG